MVYRYRTNLKKVFLTDSELHQLNERIAKSHCQNFSVYARKVLLNPNMSFVTINTDTYDQLVFELRRIRLFYLDYSCYLIYGGVLNLGKILLSSPRGLYKARKYMDYSHIY